MKTLLAFILLLSFSALSFAEDITLLAKYGGKPKTEAEKKIDQDFIDEVVRLAGSKEVASQQVVGRGFEAIRKRDFAQAMRRFNQAWLLTPDDKDVLWGLGDASAALGRIDEGLKLLQEAKNKDPMDHRLLNDIGFTYVQKAVKQAKSQKEAFQLLDEGNKYFKQAAAIEDKDDFSYFNMAMVAMYKGDYKTAWENVGKAEARGGSSIDQRFVEDLSAKMPRP